MDFCISNIDIYPSQRNPKNAQDSNKKYIQNQVTAYKNHHISEAPITDHNKNIHRARKNIHSGENTTFRAKNLAGQHVVRRANNK